MRTVQGAIVDVIAGLVVVRVSDLHAADDSDFSAGVVVLSKGQSSLCVENKGSIPKTASRGRSPGGSAGK